MKRWMTLALTAGMLCGSGCAGDRTAGDRLSSEVFYTPQAGAGARAQEPGESIDEPGALVGPGQTQDRGTAGEMSADAPEAAQPPVTPAAPEATTVPSATTAPTTRRSPDRPATQGEPTGRYMTVGAVVAEVNSAPIYANKVIERVQDDLKAKAATMAYDRFRIYAAQKLFESRRELIRDELFFAAAYKNLSERDREMATALTTRWLQQQITAAGGSAEMARRKWAAEGYDFEEVKEDEYRRFMIQIYYQRKINPRIQITAQDMREYYNRNINLFSVADQVRFRVVEIDPRELGSREAAIQRANEVRQKAEEGFDFAEMASSTQYNHSSYLRGTGGDVGWMGKGSYRSERVEKAVWELQPGQVTSVLEDNGKFYVARLEERRIGKVTPFEEPGVQDRIYDVLRREQFQALIERETEALKAAAIIRPAAADEMQPRMDDMLRPALDIVMQRYPSWVDG